MDELKVHLKEFPPNWREIADRFPGIRGKDGIVFSYGDSIYVPRPVGPLTHDVLVHERVHTVQQAGDPLRWWQNYLAFNSFRWTQEVEAYRTQWAYIAENYGREDKRRLLKQMSQALASPMYSFNITAAKAKDVITTDA